MILPLAGLVWGYSIHKQRCCGPQEVWRLDLGANASSGTSNEEDDAQGVDGDDWSEEQSKALQVGC